MAKNRTPNPKITAEIVRRANEVHLTRGEVGVRSADLTFLRSGGPERFHQAYRELVLAIHAADKALGDFVRYRVQHWEEFTLVWKDGQGNPADGPQHWSDPGRRETILKALGGKGRALEKVWGAAEEVEEDEDEDEDLDGDDSLDGEDDDEEL